MDKYISETGKVHDWNRWWLWYIYKKIELEKRIIKTEQRTAKILYSPNWDPLIQQGDARLCILKKLKL